MVEVNKAFETKFIAPPGQVHWLHDTIRNTTPPGVTLPGWSEKIGGVDVAISQVNRLGGTIFSFINFAANEGRGEGSYSYTPDAVELVLGGNLYQAPEGTGAQIVQAFLTVEDLPNQKIQEIDQAVRDHRPRDVELTGWSRQAGLVKAGIHQVDKTGGFFAYFTNNLTQQGNIAYTQNAERIVTGLLPRRRHRRRKRQ